MRPLMEVMSTLPDRNWTDERILDIFHDVWVRMVEMKCDLAEKKIDHFGIDPETDEVVIDWSDYSTLKTDIYQIWDPKKWQITGPWERSYQGPDAGLEIWTLRAKFGDTGIGLDMAWVDNKFGTSQVNVEPTGLPHLINAILQQQLELSALVEDTTTRPACFGEFS